MSLNTYRFIRWFIEVINVLSNRREPILNNVLFITRSQRTPLDYIEILGISQF